MKYNYGRTSIKQLPALFTRIDWVQGTRNLDIGGGRFDIATKYLLTKGVRNDIFDPYNQSEEHNANVWTVYNYDTATVSNVLNVVDKRKERSSIIEQAVWHVIQNGFIYISVYEGNKSGKPRVGKTGTWQANRRLESYMPEVYRAIDKTLCGQAVSVVRNKGLSYIVIRV